MVGGLHLNPRIKATSIASNQIFYMSQQATVSESSTKKVSSTIIRPAVEGDCPRMLELVKELAEYERAPQEVTVTLEHFTQSGFSASPVWWAIVAEVDGRVEGFALWYIRFSTWKGQRMYLEDFIVTEKLRGGGIGKQLFDRLLIEARGKGFNGIVWQVLEWNEPAIRFYKKYACSFDAEWVNCAVEVR